MDIPFEVRFLNDLFCLVNDRLMASRLDNSALMKRQRTETASSKTSAVADQENLISRIAGTSVFSYDG